ncbi:NAD(P)-dependent oxidoreductase [Agrobacterium sp. BA1120]|uniref:NAD-dependent epimerase/dehydratase family protein n=1 Tax=Rhizobium/Agrobacterium group TaxID=227290 RepID=UPI0007139C05|nr:MULTISPECIES: NAD(P)-dependent oxidoreductase [Rhizobium/Agrobacterium group]KQO76223.1 nucleoside-diphosphate sugar epimerase [Rhizobium sp. Leaf262]MDX8315416.1 NAD(P)-dependent oxidoreductase [Agrobacterium rosae]
MILVTGSAGRVGRAVVAALRAGGRTVRGLDLKPSGTGGEETVGSLEDAQAISKAMVGVSAVLHLGAFMSWVPADRDRMFAANVEGTRRLLDAASAAGVRRFVFASSGEVYPENRPEFLPVTEDHPLRPNSPYGLTKLLGEELVGFYQRTSSMETVILRFSHTQDAAELLDEDSFFSGPRFFLRPRIRQQQNFGNTAIAELLQSKDIDEPSHILARNENGRPFRMHITDTRDMVAGILLALDHPEAAGGTFNLGADEPVDFAALLPKIAALTGLPIVTVDFPGDGVYYHTSNERIRNKLGFEAEWTMDRMLNDAAAARRGRCAKEQRR